MLAYFVRFYFALIKFNYTRYCSYHLHMMENKEAIFPGLKKLIQTKVFSVQSQDKYPLRTAIDQRGEQTILKMLKLGKR